MDLIAAVEFQPGQSLPRIGTRPANFDSGYRSGIAESDFLSQRI